MRLATPHALVAAAVTCVVAALADGLAATPPFGPSATVCSESACDAGLSCGICLRALKPSECTSELTVFGPTISHSCGHIGVGELCEGGGECGTNGGLNNCWKNDVYERIECVEPRDPELEPVTAAQPPPTEPTSTEITVLGLPSADQDDAKSIAACPASHPVAKRCRCRSVGSGKYDGATSDCDGSAIGNFTAGTAGFFEFLAGSDNTSPGNECMAQASWKKKSVVAQLECTSAAYDGAVVTAVNPCSDTDRPGFCTGELEATCPEGTSTLSCSCLSAWAHCSSSTVVQTTNACTSTKSGHRRIFARCGAAATPTLSPTAVSTATETAPTGRCVPDPGPGQYYDGWEDMHAAHCTEYETQYDCEAAPFGFCGWEPLSRPIEPSSASSSSTDTSSTETASSTSATVSSSTATGTSTSATMSSTTGTVTSTSATDTSSTETASSTVTAITQDRLQVHEALLHEFQHWYAAVTEVLGQFTPGEIATLRSMAAGVEAEMLLEKSEAVSNVDEGNEDGGGRHRAGRSVDTNAVAMMTVRGRAVHSTSAEAV